MKKASIVLFAALGMFICLLAGISIGRHSMSGMITISDGPVESVQNIYLTDDLAHTVTSGESNTDGKININTASVSVLQMLPNIGPVLAQRIVDYRTQNGNFTAPEDLLQVEGIGKVRLEEIRNYITIGG